MKKMAITALGFVCFGLGAIGVIVPGIPTTPFLLLASYFFIRGSERANNWFINTKLYHRFLKNYLEDRSMTLLTKIAILAFATTTISISFTIIPILIGRILLIIATIIMYYYFIVKIKTRPRTKRKLEGDSEY